MGHAQGDQADALRLPPVYELAGQQVILGLGQTAQQRPDDAGVVAGGHPQADVAVGQSGPLRGDGDVGHEGHRQPRAHGGAVNGRDDGLVQVEHVVDDVPRLAEEDVQHHLGAVEGLLDHVVVAPGREGLTGAGDDHRPHLVVPPQVQPDAGELVVQAAVGGVEGLGTVHGDDGHPVPLLGDQVAIGAVVHHLYPPWQDSPLTGGANIRAGPRP